MLRNVDSTDSEISRTLALKHLPNGSEHNVPEVKKLLPCFREGVHRGRFDLGKALLNDISKATDFDDMPSLESSPLLDGLDGVPASPEMPTLVPIALDSEDAKNGIDTHLSKNGYYRLNKENVNLSDPESPHLKNKNMSGVSLSPLTPTLATAKKKRGRPKKKAKPFVPTAEQATNDKRFQPVVVLKRLSVDQESLGSRSRDSSNDSWSQWPEEYEGCSYDDYVCEAETVESFPEVDLIDGVEFLSFLQEGDVKEFTSKDNQTIVFPSESSCTDMESCPDGNTSVKDEHGFIVPTKTRDITQIKGWKRKQFFEDSLASSTPSSVSPNFLESEGVDRGDESSREGLGSNRSSACPTRSSHCFSRSSPFGSRSSSCGSRSSVCGSRCSSCSTRSRLNTPADTSESSRVVFNTADSVNSDCDERCRNEILNEGNREREIRDSEEEDDMNKFERSFQDSLRLPGTPPESYDRSDEEPVDMVTDEQEDEESVIREQDLKSMSDTKISKKMSTESTESTNEVLVEENDELLRFENEMRDDEEQSEQHDSIEEDNVLKLGEQPDLYGTAKTSAFASRSLDDFLDKHSTLDISFLRECKPMVEFIPNDHPVLNVGYLKIDDEVKRNKWSIPSRYSFQAKPAARMQLPRQLPKKACSKAQRSTPNNKVTKEKVIRKSRTSTEIVSSFKEPEKSEVVTQDKIKESRIIFVDEDSNLSSASSASRHSKLSSTERPATPDYSQGLDERQETYLEETPLFSCSDTDENKIKDSETANFFIDFYEPMIVDEVTLAESRNRPFEVIQETVWSVKDTIREERKMYDILCELKSPDSYLISKIQFAEESAPEVEELLTEDDANEIAKSVYMGYGSVQEMVTEINVLEEAKKVRLAKSLQLAREKKRKKREQLKTVKKFVQWIRETSQPSDKEEPVTTRKRREKESPVQSLGPFINLANANYKKRRIRPPARFLDGAPMSDDEIAFDENSDIFDKTFRHKLPTVRPHSAAIPLGFDNREEAPKSLPLSERSKTLNKSTLVDASKNNSTSSDSESSLESDSSVSPTEPVNDFDTDSEDEIARSPSSAHIQDNSLEPDNEAVTDLPETTDGQRESEFPSVLETYLRENSTSTKSPKSTTKNSFSNNSSTASTDNSINLTTSPENPKLMHVNVTLPVYNQILDVVDEQVKNSDSVKTCEKSNAKKDSTKPVSSDTSCLGIVLNNGVHTITPKNSNHIERIKMNLNSALNIGSEAIKAIGRSKTLGIRPLTSNVLHLTPLNEYQWKPTDSNRAPIIKSFLIDAPHRKSNVLNIPLAAVAQPVTGTKFPNESVYLLYGSLENCCPLVQEDQESSNSPGFQGLTIRVGKQELLLSCSIALAKAPVRLNAVIGKVITPLLLYPALKPNGDQTSGTVPFTITPVKSSKPPTSIFQTASDQTSEMVQNQKAQHLRILTKDNKLTVENMSSQLSVNPASCLTPVTQMPRTSLLTGVPRHVTQLGSLRFPGPGQAVLETTLQSASGPRKVLILPGRKVADQLRAGLKSLTENRSTPLTLTGTNINQKTPGVQEVATQKVATSPSKLQYVYVHNTGTSISAPIQRLQSSGISILGKESLLLAQKSKDGQAPPVSADIPVRNAQEGEMKDILEPEFQITDVRTCTPPPLDQHEIITNSPTNQDVRTCTPPPFDQQEIMTNSPVNKDVRTCMPPPLDQQEVNTNSAANQDKVPSSPPSIVDIASDDDNSVWISGEGETCFVMRLPDDDEIEEVLPDEDISS